MSLIFVFVVFEARPSLEKGKGEKRGVVSDGGGASAGTIYCRFLPSTVNSNFIENNKINKGIIMRI